MRIDGRTRPGSARTPRPAGKAGYQEVQVKTTNPEFRVRARKGYEYGK